MDSKKFHSEKSQAMVLVLFITAVLGVLAGGLALMWESEIRARDLERDGLIAFYLAQAGAERAKARLDSYQPGTGWYGWYTGVSGGQYRFFVETVGPKTWQITSYGQALGVSGNVIAERQIRLRVQNGKDTSFPPSDQTPGSWQEE